MSSSGVLWQVLNLLHNGITLLESSKSKMIVNNSTKLTGLSKGGATGIDFTSIGRDTCQRSGSPRQANFQGCHWSRCSSKGVGGCFSSFLFFQFHGKGRNHGWTILIINNNKIIVGNNEFHTKPATRQSRCKGVLKRTRAWQCLSANHHWCS